MQRRTPAKQRDDKPTHRRSLYLFVLIVVACLLFSRLLYLYLGDPNRYPIHTIKITASYEHITHAQIAALLQQYQEKSFFTLPVQQLHHTLQQLTWIDTIDIKRVYPDTIHLIVTEKHPIATWNGSFLTEKGQVFYDPAALSETLSLPHLVSPSQDKLEILQMYKTLSQLLAQHQLSIRYLREQENHAWDTHLQNGIHLKLGQQQVIERMKRFVKAYPLLIQRPGQLICVDVRYTQGLAAKWAPATSDAPFSKAEDPSTAPSSR